jgi:hypothetical protein
MFYMVKSKRLFLPAAILLLIFLALSLSGSKTRNNRQVDFTVVEEGTQIKYKPEGPNLEIFIDQGKFESFHKNIHRTRIPPPDAPTLDFDNGLVIFISYGDQKSSGYSIDVRSVIERRDALVIKSVLITPPDDSFQALAMTHPYVILYTTKDKNKRVELTDLRGTVLASENI